ncbi:MAG TPA: CehA/McbA family metallohydrolase [Verrucomicrobiae bacterium]|nr:CehA/McbA family metallohydrolase [Verrucomicrobiae bacterium]
MLLSALLLVATANQSAAQNPALPIVRNVEWQPLTAQVRRLLEATGQQGAPLAPAVRAALDQLLAKADPEPEALQSILDRYCLFGVTINPEMRVKVAVGAAKPELVEHGWRQFLVKVANDAGATSELVAISPNAIAAHEGGASYTPSTAYYRKRGNTSPLPPNSDLWLDVQMVNGQPMVKKLSGLRLEYRLIQLYSRDAGKREAKIAFNAGQGTQDLGFRSEADVLFTALPAQTLTFGVRDENNKPVTAMFLIRDQQGRVYPSQARRLAPDFGFHPQVYRADAEKEKLPDGTYTVEFGRGPEYLTQTRTVTIQGKSAKFDVKLERWIDPSKMGWWSGDHHIHAAGCAHYTKPTEGVLAPDMMRHCLGEDLKVGCNLTWGPCFDFQKQFFTGKDDKVSQFPYLLHYDVEVSGFGSHQSGHLCLLRLKEEIYPGGDSDTHWPTLCLNTLKWARKQGAVVGPAHSGWGLEVKTSELPNFEVPKFDGIGAVEYIADVTHEIPDENGKMVRAVDFISTVDTPHVWELNIWYHTLNAGFRTRISGETDFPCIYDERVGLGRSYVKMDGKLDYGAWCEGIRQGRNYVGDGRSHLINFKVNDTSMGENGSELKLAKAGTVRVSVKAAARLDETAHPEIKNRRYDQHPYWHIERARIDGTREVPVEVIVNGFPVARKNIVADGTMRDLDFDVKLDRSSWVAVRILPSSHTNPIFVLVDDKPIRPSRKSVEWCLKGVDQCWSQKQRFIKADEMDDAKKTYDHAREVYKQRLAESAAD